MSATVLAAEAHSFTSPGTADFWQPLIGDGAWAITRPMVVMALTTVGLVLLMTVGTKRLSLVPSKGQAALEALYDLPRTTIGRDIIGRAEMRPHLPLLFSIFSLILVSNVLGVVPVVQYPTFARIGFPIALVLFVYVWYHAVGIRRKGLRGYLGGLVPPGLPRLIVPVIFLLEAITAFITQPVTLALRLFGNMFAGHLILLLFSLGAEYMLIEGGAGLKVVSVPTFLLFLVLTVFELLIEFLQAYVFTLLTATYIASSLSHEH